MTGGRIRPESHAQIRILHQEGYSSREIATRLKLVQSTVVRSLKMQQTSGKYEYNKPAGRPSCTSKRLDNSIITAAKRSPRKSSLAIQSGLPLQFRSTSTIRRRLFNAGLKSFRAAKKPSLSVKNMTDRLSFCEKYKDWTREQWKSVIFSDETCISQFHAFTRHVRRPKYQRNNIRYIVPTVKNASKVMIWGAICYNGVEYGSCQRVQLSMAQFTSTY